jgi:hypothetical protein
MKESSALQVQFYEIWAFFKFCYFRNIWFSDHSSNDPKYFYTRWKVSIWGWWKKKFNIWTWDEVKMNGQSCTYNHHLHTSNFFKKASYFFVLGHVAPPWTLHLQNWTFHSMGRLQNLRCLKISLHFQAQMVL